MEHKLHFIGIGGIGMSAIALIMLKEGFVISGSDIKKTPLTQSLTENGASISYQHAAENLPADCQAVVYSSAVKPDNAEMAEASRRGLPIYKRAEMLAYLMSRKIGIGVAGAHGKTTTSGMIATMLTMAGTDPTVIIGGTLPSIGGGNARVGKGPALVAEADESDGTFLLLRPKIAVVTNVEADHLDYYNDFHNVCSAFGQYIEQVPEDGCVVLGTDCPVCADLGLQAHCKVITYGLEHAADYTAGNIVAHSFRLGGRYQR